FCAYVRTYRAGVFVALGGHVKPGNTIDAVAVEQGHGRNLQFPAGVNILFRHAAAFEETEGRPRMEFDVIRFRHISVVVALDEPGLGREIAEDTIERAVAHGDIPLFAIPPIIPPPVSRGEPRTFGDLDGTARNSGYDVYRLMLYDYSRLLGRTKAPESESHSTIHGSGRLLCCWSERLHDEGIRLMRIEHARTANVSRADQMANADDGHLYLFRRRISGSE